MYYNIASKLEVKIIYIGWTKFTGNIIVFYLLSEAFGVI
jgi:hypothetical protein